VLDPAVVGSLDFYLGSAGAIWRPAVGRVDIVPRAADGNDT
jgi:hypothetical protein